MENRNRLYLIRHGQIENHERFPVYGYTDINTTEVGDLQLKTMAERLRYADIHAIYSSDLKRAKKGANLISQYHNVPISVISEFREMNFGDWEGVSYTDILEKFPEKVEERRRDPANFRPPGDAESFLEFSQRVMKGLAGLLERHNGDNILLVAHGGVNRIILCNALGMDIGKMFNIEQSFGCLNIIDYFSDSTVIKLVNG